MATNVPAKAGSKAVAGPVSVQQLMAADIEAGVTGNEGLTAKDLAVPFLSILQSKSPQAEKGSPTYIKGAEAGDIYNNVTQQIHKGAIEVVPCGFRTALVEWRQRGAEGGGYVREHPDDRELSLCKKDERTGKMTLPNGNILVQTQYHYVLLVKGDGSAERAVISMASTQLKKGMRWNTQIVGLQMKLADGRVFNPPRYSHIYTVGSVYESNAKGSWMGWEILAPKPIIDPQLYAFGKKFAEEVKAGTVKISMPVDQQNTDHGVADPEVF